MTESRTDAFKPSPPPVSRWLLLVLGALTALGAFSVDLYLPAFADMAHDLGAGPGEVERTLAVFFFGLGVGQLLYGPLADRYGRKPPLCAGLVLYICAALGGMMAHSIGVLLCWRFLQAVGCCAGMVISRAVVRDLFDVSRAARALSMLVLAMGVAPIVAPLVGGWMLAYTGWRPMFALMALFGAICLIGVWRILPETLRPEQAAHVRALDIGSAYWHTLRTPGFFRYILAGCVTQAGMYSYVVGASHALIGVYHIAPDRFGWYFGINALGLMLLSQVNARLLKCYGPARILGGALAGYLLLGSAMLAAAWAGAIPLAALLALCLMYQSGIALVMPNAHALALASLRRHTGLGSALIGTMQFGVATLAASCVGWFQDGTIRSVLGVMGMTGIGGCLLFHSQAMLRRARG